MRIDFEAIDFRKGFVIAFVLGFVIRLIPEILSYPYPIGWDTIYYAARINDGMVWTHWSDVFSSWMIYGILSAFSSLSSLEPFMVLKIVAPLLYGGTAAGIYFVAWKKLKWNVTKSLLACSLFVFQLATLGISWHFYRNILGMMVLLFTIPLLKHDLNWKEGALLSMLSVLVVWGHELAAVSMFVMVLGLMVVSYIKKEQIPTKPFLATVPALAVFIIGILPFFSSTNGLNTNILQVNDNIFARPAGLFFLTDYLNVFNPVEHYTSYFELFSHVTSLFALLYILILPLIGIGYFKDRIISSWMALLVIGSFGCLVVPFSALLFWNRWMLMLVFPFTFFAANGLWKLSKSEKALAVSKIVNWIKIPKKIGITLTLLSVVVGALFMTWPLIDGKYGIIGTETTFRYIPSTMQTNTVPLVDTEGTINSFEWINENLADDSSVLVHDVFCFWSNLYLDEHHTAVFFSDDLQKASELALENGFTTSYLVWWNEDIGWYGLNLSEQYVSVFDSGRISVFQMT